MEARILGTLTSQDSANLRFAEDISNYYSARGAYVWKPAGDLLEAIVNLTHRGNSLDMSEIGLSPDADIRVPVARTRFAAADESDPQDSVRVPVRIDPTDLLKRRTVFPGYVPVREVQRDEDHRSGRVPPSRQAPEAASRPSSSLTRTASTHRTIPRTDAGFIAFTSW